ncbi:uncharacterized protein [Panulirus ornatus]
MVTFKNALLVKVLATLLVPSALATNITTLEGYDLPTITDIIQKQLEKYLSKFEGLHIPAIPTIDIEYEDIVSVAFSLNNIDLSGVSNVNVTEFAHHGKKPGSQSLTTVLPQISLSIGDYVSAGHLLNLPFNGEGPVSLTLYDLSINITYEWDSYSIFSGYCASDNSTKFDLDLRRMQVNFENLNPGTDLGQLINIVLSSFGPDIVDYLELQLNTSLNGPLDDAIINLVNHLCPNLNEDDTLDHKISDAGQALEDLLHAFLRANTRLDKSS